MTFDLQVPFKNEPCIDTQGPMFCVDWWYSPRCCWLSSRLSSRQTEHRVRVTLNNHASTPVWQMTHLHPFNVFLKYNIQEVFRMSLCNVSHLVEKGKRRDCVTSMIDKCIFLSHIFCVHELNMRINLDFADTDVHVGSENAYVR